MHPSHSRAALAICLAVAGIPVNAEDAQIVPATESVADASQADWSIRWWQWAFSFERTRSPISDRTGQMCASRQSGNVWFLAGTYGTHRVVRTCTVPAGKTLFFPLINYVAFRGDDSDESCQSLQDRAKVLTDKPDALVLEVDGHRYASLEAHRLHTECFSLVTGQPKDAAADGYFVAIRPLTKGRHELNFGGVLPSLAQAVTYTLEVE